MSTTRCGSIVHGAGRGAGREKNTPWRSMRVAGPGTDRRSKLSTNRAETMSMTRTVAARPRRSGGHRLLDRPPHEHRAFVADSCEAAPAEHADGPPAEVDLALL